MRNNPVSPLRESSTQILTESRDGSEENRVPGSDRPEHCCSCAEAGFCFRRSRVVHPIYWGKCQAGHCDSIDRLYSNYDINIGRPDRLNKSADVPVSTLGTRIKKSLEALGEYKITCGSCNKYLVSLNLVPLSEVNLEEIPLNLQVALQFPTEKHKELGWSAADTQAWLRRIIDESWAQCLSEMSPSYATQSL